MIIKVAGVDSFPASLAILLERMFSFLIIPAKVLKLIVLGELESHANPCIYTVAWVLCPPSGSQMVRTTLAGSQELGVREGQFRKGKKHKGYMLVRRRQETPATFGFRSKSSDLSAPRARYAW